MGFSDFFSRYTKENYSDIAFYDSKGLFPDIETGYTQVRIVYNNAYHSLDLRFNGMGDFESLFNQYVFPVLMKYRDFSTWKMASARVIRIKIPCINEEVGFIEEDCDEQMDRARTLIEILSKIDVSTMYSEQRGKRENTFKTIPQIETETDMFNNDYTDLLVRRYKEIEEVGNNELGRSGIHARLENMAKDINGFLKAHEKFINENPDLLCNIKVLGLKETIINLLSTF